MDAGHLAQVIGQIAEHHVAQRLVGVLGDGPDLGNVLLAKTAGDHVHDLAAKSRHALAGSDHERADDKWETAGPVDAEVHDVIEQSADVLGFFLGKVFPAGIRRGLQIDVVGGEVGVFVFGEFLGLGLGLGRGRVGAGGGIGI